MPLSKIPITDNGFLLKNWHLHILKNNVKIIFCANSCKLSQNRQFCVHFFSKNLQTFNIGPRLRRRKTSPTPTTRWSRSPTTSASRWPLYESPQWPKMLFCDKIFYESPQWPKKLFCNKKFYESPQWPKKLFCNNMFVKHHK
jgi:hypothetical protein